MKYKHTYRKTKESLFFFNFLNFFFIIIPKSLLSTPACHSFPLLITLYTLRNTSNSSVASPICQEGQSEKTFPIFALSSRFLLFFFRCFLIFPLFFRFLAIFSLSGMTLCPPPLVPPVATPLTSYESNPQLEHIL